MGNFEILAQFADFIHRRIYIWITCFYALNQAVVIIMALRTAHILKCGHHVENQNVPKKKKERKSVREAKESGKAQTRAQTNGKILKLKDHLKCVCMFGPNVLSIFSLCTIKFFAIAMANGLFSDSNTAQGKEKVCAPFSFFLSFFGIE